MSRKRKDRRPELKRRLRKRNLIITISVFSLIALFIGIVAIVGVVGTNNNIKKIQSFAKVGAELTPVKDAETGNWTFTTDREFKVLQLTDIHIGAGAFSLKKDAKAIDAVYTLIARTKPDLVIATGDIAYPVPFQAGTFNNIREAEVFATLMEQCGVYWAISFGNHDTEAYSMYDRAQISKFYSQEKWKYCLYEEGDKDITGYGNYVINVKNTSNIITHAMFILDSHSYTDGDYLGIAWKYDNIKDNQINWYKEQVKVLDTINEANGGGKIKSTMYFHIPLKEYLTALNLYLEHGNTEEVQLLHGDAKETGKVVYAGIGEDNLFETILELDSTLAIFCGHDHLNNFAINYKGVILNYGLSIDYLAYPGIEEKTEQRGGKLINIATDGSIEIVEERLV